MLQRRENKRYWTVIGEKSKKQVKVWNEEGTKWDDEDKKEIISVEFSSGTLLLTTSVTHAIKDAVVWLLCCVTVIGLYVELYIQYMK